MGLRVRGEAMPAAGSRPPRTVSRSGNAPSPPTALSPSQAPYTRSAGKTRISRSTWFSVGAERPK
jgi:hypothetical protein